jgi:DUF4097 and DUF4098 domain-containing protein YvlB
MKVRLAVPTQWQLKTAGLVVPSLLLCSVVSAAGPKRSEQHFKVTAHPVITIHNPNGVITVKAWDRAEVLVISTPATDKVDVDAEQMGNRVDISTHANAEGVAADELRADYQINVPADAELQIHDDSGSVNVASVLGDLNVETIGAGVDLSDTAGYLTVKTVGGSFQCLRCSGQIDVTSISGSFRLIDMRTTRVDAHTTTGNILFDSQFLPNGTYHLKDNSGVIEVRFSPDDSFDLSAQSLNGKVNSQASLVPKKTSSHVFTRLGDSLFGTFNAGRAKVELTSFDGTINILKRD